MGFLRLGLSTVVYNEMGFYELYRSILKEVPVTTCTQGGSGCKAVRRGVVNSEGTKVAQGPDRAFTVSNRVFYKELEEGVC